jgi:hypothetical protein
MSKLYRSQHSEEDLDDEEDTPIYGSLFNKKEKICTCSMIDLVHLNADHEDDCPEKPKKKRWKY